MMSSFISTRRLKSALIFSHFPVLQQISRFLSLKVLIIQNAPYVIGLLPPQTPGSARFDASFICYSVTSNVTKSKFDNPKGKNSEDISDDGEMASTPKKPVGELFAQGPIRIMVTAIQGGQVKLGLSADPRFLILREELFKHELGKL